MSFVGLKLFILFILLGSTLIIAKLFLIYIAQTNLYAFCELRRRLMGLLHENKISSQSLVFLYHYKILNHFIHYSKKHRFDDVSLLSAIARYEKDLEHDEFYKKLNNEIEKTDQDVKDFVHDFYDNIVKAFMRRSVLLQAILVGLIVGIATKLALIDPLKSGLKKLKNLLGPEKIDIRSDGFHFFINARKIRSQI